MFYRLTNLITPSLITAFVAGEFLLLYLARTYQRGTGISMEVANLYRLNQDGMMKID
jgi:hypothetical protein